MKYWFDWEFLRPIHPISLGIVSEDWRTYYAESSEVDWSLDTDGWVSENVRPHLIGDTKPLTMMAQEVLSFVGDDPNPTFCAWAGDYDYVILLELIGGFMARPDNWPSYHHELKEDWEKLGRPPLLETLGSLHNALDDSWHNRDRDYYMQYLARTRRDTYVDPVATLAKRLQKENHGRPVPRLEVLRQLAEAEDWARQKEVEDRRDVRELTGSDLFPPWVFFPDGTRRPGNRLTPVEQMLANESA